MAIAFRAAAAAIRGAGATMTITEPASSASGDLLISCIYYETAAWVNLLPPTGWQGAARMGGGSTPIACVTAYIIRGSSAPNLVWNGVAANYHEIYTIGLTGVDPYYPIIEVGAVGAMGNNTVHSPQAPPVAWATANSWGVVVAADFAGYAPWVAPSGYTLRTDTGGSDAAMATKALGATPGTETPPAWGVTSGGATGDWWDGQLFIVRPVDGGANPLTGVRTIPRGFKRMRRLGKQAA